VALPNREFDARDEENASIFCIGEEVLVEREPVVIRDGEDVEPFVSRFRDEFFCRVRDVVKRILCRVKVEVGLQRSWAFTEMIRS